MAVDSFHPVRIYRNLKAAPEQVFEAWLDPKKIAQWMTLPFGDKVVKIKTQALPRTTFSFRILRDGKELNHIGEYIEIRKPHRLVFTWGVEGFPMGASRVAVDFEPSDGETTLTLTHRGVDEEFITRTQQGWEKIITALEMTI